MRHCSEQNILDPTISGGLNDCKLVNNWCQTKKNVPQTGHDTLILQFPTFQIITRPKNERREEQRGQHGYPAGVGGTGQAPRRDLRHSRKPR